MQSELHNVHFKSPSENFAKFKAVVTLAGVTYQSVLNELMMDYVIKNKNLISDITKDIP